MGRLAGPADAGTVGGRYSTRYVAQVGMMRFAKAVSAMSSVDGHVMQGGPQPRRVHRRYMSVEVLTRT